MRAGVTQLDANPLAANDGCVDHSPSDRTSTIGGDNFLCWWLAAIASGPEAFNEFTNLTVTPLGQVILFGFVWSLNYHLLYGIRHLAWGLGYRFQVGTARLVSAIAIVGAYIIAVGAFVVAYSGNAGWFQ